MQVEFTKLPQSRILLNVEVDKDSVERAITRACKNISQKSSVPGFRKGKAPRKILERLLGKEVILDEAKNLLLIESYPRAIKEVDFLPLGEPALDIKSFEEDGPMVFTIEVDTKPTFELPDYRSVNIDLDSNKFKIKDEYLEESINILKKQLAETKEITERGLQKGDFVDLSMQISYPDEDAGEIETRPRRCFFNEENFSHNLIEQIEGLKTDESKEFELEEPVPDEEGKETGKRRVSCAVTLNSIIEFNVPDLTDEFIEKNTKYKNMEEVKSEFSREWERILSDKKKDYIKDAITDKLLIEVDKENNFELPETLITSKVNNLMGAHILQLSKSHVSLDDYLKQAGLEKEDYVNKLKEEAVRIIKTELILEAIGEKENIQLSKEDEKEVKNKVKALGDMPGNLKLSERKDLEEYMGIKVKKEKVLDFLLENVKINEN